MLERESDKAIGRRIEERLGVTIPGARDETPWRRKVIEHLKEWADYEARRAAELEAEARKLPPPATGAEALRRELENVHYRQGEHLALNDSRLLDRAAGRTEGTHSE
jgi:hypothetical protein